MIRRLLASYLLLSAFVLVVLEVPLGVSLVRNQQRVFLDGEAHDAGVLATRVEDAVEQGQTATVQALVGDYAGVVGGRVVVLDAASRTLADSNATGQPAEDFSSRPELIAALKGDSTQGVRYSVTLGYHLAYAAAPIASGGVVHGAVRITYNATILDRRSRNVWALLVGVALVVLAAVTFLGSALARSTTKPLRSLERATDRLATGDLKARAPVPRGPAEISSLTTTFNGMAARLEGLMAAQSAFVANASHELRSPLTALRLRLENLQPAVSGPERQDLEAAIRETMRLARIIDGLLVMAEGDGRTPERGRVDVAATVKERLGAWAALARQRGVALRFEPGRSPTGPTPGTEGPQLPLIAEAMPGALEQVLDNYLANALDVAPTGSTVTVTAQRGQRWVTLSVLDEGPGLSDEDLTRAFDRFWRGPHRATGGSGRRSHGAGLGLSIVAELATASGGQAELQHREGPGLAAVIRLPCAWPIREAG